MVFVLLRVVFTVAFSHVLRFSQARTTSPLGAAVANYLVAALGSAAWTAAAGFRWHVPTMVLGAAAGVTYVTSLVMLLPSMRKSVLSVTGAVVQLSLMAPVAVSIWRFGEYPNHFQAAGILLTLIALPVLAATSAVEGEGARPKISGLTLFLFLSAALSQVLMKEFSMVSRPSDLPLYSTALFTAATISTYVWRALVPSEPPVEPGSKRLYGVWPVGTVLGVVNLLQLLALLLALRELPAVVVFPVSAALGIVANALASLWLWGERPPPAGWLGIGMAIGAVILLNLK